MDFLDRIESNVQVQRLSFMTCAPEIVALCQRLTGPERADALPGI